MENIMDLATRAFRGETLDRLSSQLGESRAATEHGIAQAVPMSLAGIAAQAQSEQSANDLLGSFRDGTAPGLDPDDLDRVVSDPAETNRIVQSGGGFLSRFLGDKFGPMLDMVTRQSGLSSSSATKLLGIAAPLVLGMIGKQAKAQNLDAGGLSRLLADEGQKVSGHLPASFSSLFKSGGGGVAGVREHRPLHGEQHRDGKGWLIAGLAVVGIAALWWAFRRQPEIAELDVRMPDVVSPQPDDRQPVAGTDVIVLSDDADALETYFEGTAPVPQRFVLETLEFDAGAKRVSSNAMLDDAAQTLKAQPSAKLRIEGHADRQGKVEDNRMLSQERANAVKNYLVGRGVLAQQIEAVGMSELKPIADDDTAAGRAQNRRVELIVIQR